MSMHQTKVKIGDTEAVKIERNWPVHKQSKRLHNPPVNDL